MVAVFKISSHQLIYLVKNFVSLSSPNYLFENLLHKSWWIWWHLSSSQFQDWSDWSERAPSNRPVRKTSCFLPSWSWLELWSVSSGDKLDNRYPAAPQPPLEPAAAPAPLAASPWTAGSPPRATAPSLLWPTAGIEEVTAGAAAETEAELAAGGLLANLSSVCLWACCCLCSWSSIWSCCNCDDEDPATLLTPDNWDNNSAMGSTASRADTADGDNVDKALGPPVPEADWPDVELELAGLLWRLVRWELRPPLPWAIRLKI